MNARIFIVHGLGGYPKEGWLPWLMAPVDFKKVYSCIEKSIAIFSDNDPWVPLSNVTDFENKLHSEIIIEHNKRHFSGSRDGAFTLALVLEKILIMIN